MSIDDAECVWPVAAVLGEGPMWSAPDQTLWFVDIKGNAIHAFDERTGARRSFATPQFAAFIFRDLAGGYVCGLKSGLHRFDPEQGSFQCIVEVDAEHRANRLNDGYVDAAGRLWFGTMDNEERAPTGSLYRFGAGRLERMDPDYIITNGPAMSPDGRILYHVDTHGRCVYAFDVDAAGNLSGKRLFTRVEEPGVYPDGPAEDSRGNVWIANE